MNTISRFLMVACVLVSGHLLAQTEENALQTDDPVSLSELASMADVIVLAQARDTDYIYRRDFPVKGSAYLKVLIPYKVDQPLDIIEVYEEGLHENECYFPNPSVFEEGKRYLLFLKKDPDSNERYRGLEPGCALDVLVASDYRYALRIPITGMTVSDDLDDYIQDLSFNDNYAIETEESLSSTERETWLAEGWLVENDGAYQYTQGIDLTVLRQLLGEDGISLDRHQKRLEPEIDQP